MIFKMDKELTSDNLKDGNIIIDDYILEINTIEPFISVTVCDNGPYIKYEIDFTEYTLQWTNGNMRDNSLELVRKHMYNFCCINEV